MFALIAGILASIATAGESNSAGELRAARQAHVALMARDAKAAKAAEWTAREETFARLAKRFAHDAEVRDAHGEFLWDRGDEPRAIGEWKAAKLSDSNQPRVP